MQAVQLVAWERPAEVREVPEPAPGPGEVLLRVTGAGLCHSDLHLMHWPAGTHALRRCRSRSATRSPATVAALGDGADGDRRRRVRASSTARGAAGGARAAAAARSTCASAASLRHARRAAGSAATAAWPSTSCSRPPGWRCRSEISTRSRRRRWPTPALTPYHAVKRALRDLRPGSAAVVIGVGGPRARRRPAAAGVERMPRRGGRPPSGGARRRPRGGRRRRAARPTGSARRTSAARRAGAGAALVIDCVGVDATLELAAGCVAPGGHVAILGVGGGTLPLRFGAIPFETPVILSNWGTRAELAEVVGPRARRRAEHRGRARRARGGARRL